MMDTLSPSLVAGIHGGQTAVHVIGNWNVNMDEFREVVEEASAALALRDPTRVHGFQTYISSAWDKRDFAATFFKEGVMAVRVRDNLPPS